MYGTIIGTDVLPKQRIFCKKEKFLKNIKNKEKLLFWCTLKAEEKHPETSVGTLEQQSMGLTFLMSIKA